MPLMARVNCRLWWPKQLSSSSPYKTESSSSTSKILFGWLLPSSDSSLDIVVAPLSVSIDTISKRSDLQGILQSTNEKMTQFLQEKSTFSMLGHILDCSCHNVGLEQDGPTSAHRNACQDSNQELRAQNVERSCGCSELDGIIMNYRRFSCKNGDWIQLSYDSLGYICKGISWTPKLHHIHWGGRKVPSSDVHFQVLIYDPPTFGAHHFSLELWGSIEKVRHQVKSPMWVDNLHQKQTLPDLNTVVFAVNSATFATMILEENLKSESNFDHSSLISVLVSVPCHLAAGFLASFFTLTYIILQFFYSLLRHGSRFPLYAFIAKLFSHTWTNIYIRSCQLLYWPIHLQDSGFRSQPNVEYAHKATLHRHSMWSSVVVDVLLGNIVGFALLHHMDIIRPLVLNLIHLFTNHWLRSGCVWLMGVPAGFKLNTELAGILGTISLNAIQIWSTLWVYLGFLFKYFITVLALSGIVSGLTIPAAITVDVIMLATSHVSTLHWLISLLYSHQIKSLAALWRLFRGKKWNPLRQRIDSYDYTVKQHVVGSLLFTPLLLLLPTTSVFYIFFTILKTTISFVCIVIEITISILHATPYHEIFLWVLRPGRFPSGIWFDMVSSQRNNSVSSSMVRCIQKDISLSNSHQKMDEENNGGTHILLFFLRTNFASLGQIISPHYMAVFRGVSMFSGSSSALGILIGTGFQAALQTGLPSTMPWMYITYTEYWVLCFGSVFSCLKRR